MIIKEDKIIDLVPIFMEKLHEECLYPNNIPDYRLVRGWKKHKRDRFIFNVGKIVCVAILSIIALT